MPRSWERDSRDLDQDQKPDKTGEAKGQGKEKCFKLGSFIS
jgi:hypothetical protein